MDEDLAALKKALEEAGSAIVGVSRACLLRILSTIEGNPPQPKGDTDAPVS